MGVREWLGGMRKTHTLESVLVILPGHSMLLHGLPPGERNNAEAFPFCFAFLKVYLCTGINQANPLSTTHFTYYCVNITIYYHLYHHIIIT